jgi:hypothetical protein
LPDSFNIIPGRTMLLLIERHQDFSISRTDCGSVTQGEILAVQLGLANWRLVAYLHVAVLVGKTIGQQPANKQLKRVIEHDGQQD